MLAFAFAGLLLAGLLVPLLLTLLLVTLLLAPLTRLLLILLLLRIAFLLLLLLLLLRLHHLFKHPDLAAHAFQIPCGFNVAGLPIQRLAKGPGGPAQGLQSSLRFLLQLPLRLLMKCVPKVVE